MIDPTNNCPHIIRLVDADDGIPDQYFIAVEQQLLIKVPNLSDAILLLLSVHYTFNIEYNSKIHDLLCFIQEYVLEVPFNGRKSPLYSSFTSAIECY